MIPVTISTAYPPDLIYPVVDVVDAGYNADVAMTLIKESSFTNRHPFTELVDAGYRDASNSDDCQSRHPIPLLHHVHVYIDCSKLP